MTLSDDALLDAFERCTLAPSDFHHRDHVRLAWLMLRREPPLRVLERFPEGLRRFASSLGKETLYHETRTWCWILLIHDRMARGGAEEWPEFEAAHPELLDSSLLDSFYQPRTLASDTARATFLFPDRFEK